MRKRLSAFTLIELLVVIAIIAVLAAILFPVFARAKEASRQTTCMSNMHEMYVKASIYKTDNGLYPCHLLGYAERADTLPWQGPQDGPPLPAGAVKEGYLFPAYISNVERFHCPNDTVNDQRAVTIAEFPPYTPIYDKLTKSGDHT